MLTFIFLIVITVLLLVSLDRFSKGTTNIKEHYTDLKFINYTKDSDINIDDNLCNDIYNENTVIEVIKSNPLYSSYKEEIKLEDFLELLDKLKNKTKLSNYLVKLKESNSFKIDNSDKIPRSFSVIKKSILKDLSEMVKIYDQQYDFIFREYTEDNSKILKNRYYRKIFEYIDYLDFIITISRKDKNMIYTLRVNAYFNYNNFNINIESIELIGITTYENSTKKFYKFYRNKFLNCDNKGVHLSLSREPYCDESDNIDFKEFMSNTENTDWELNNSKCFFKESNNKIECLSIDINGKKGIWDTRCKDDIDCPFFGNNGNLNYPNSRGGCNPNGYCELPINMKEISYRLYSKSDEFKPLCHNCPEIPNCIGRECSKCCDSQENPDYAFKGDISERRDNQKILKEKGLEIFDLKLL